MPPVKILKVEPVTHDVRRFTVEKPEGFRFEPGQATLVSINKPEWQQEKRPFTFTSLNDWPELEFTIKMIPYDGNDSWVEGTLMGIRENLRAPQPPKPTPDCEYCAFAGKWAGA